MSPPAKQSSSRPKKAKETNSSAPPSGKEAGQDEEGKDKTPKSFGAKLREYADDFVFICLLIMFVRSFVVEQYKIPTGSMTPTIVGDWVSEVDYDEDGDLDLLVLKSPDPKTAMQRGNGTFQVFMRDGKNWVYKGFQTLGPEGFRYIEKLAKSRYSSGFLKALAANRGWDRPLHPRYDRIFVSKFAYWFSPPERGDLVVFKIPLQIWNDKTPVYIKRAVGLSQETISFLPEPYPPDGSNHKGRLVVDGELVEDPPFFRNQFYSAETSIQFASPEITYIQAESAGRSRNVFEACHVPPEHLFVLGDNTDSSANGRAWGTVPYANLKGKAFLRYWPWRKFAFLH